MLSAAQGKSASILSVLMPGPLLKLAWKIHLRIRLHPKGSPGGPGRTVFVNQAVWCNILICTKKPPSQTGLFML